MSKIWDDNYLSHLIFQNLSKVYYCCNIKMHLNRKKEKKKKKNTFTNTNTNYQTNTNYIKTLKKDKVRK